MGRKKSFNAIISIVSIQRKIMQDLSKDKELTIFFSVKIYRDIDIDINVIVIANVTVKKTFNLVYLQVSFNILKGILRL